MRGKITQYTLKKSAEHILYEVWMFYQTLILLKTAKRQIEINILLDAYAVHARNLFDFFYPDKKNRPDDMIIYDFIDRAIIFNRNKTSKKDLLFIRKKANKQVAHLTYARNRYSLKTNKIWPFVDIGRKMYQTLNAFYTSLPRPYLKWPKIIELKKIIDDLNGKI